MHLFNSRLVLWAIYSLLIPQITAIPVPEENLDRSPIDDRNELVPGDSDNGSSSLVRRAETAPPRNGCYEVVEKLRGVSKYVFPTPGGDSGELSLRRRLGGGSQGTVYEAQMILYGKNGNDFKRDVAVKVSGGGRDVDQSLLSNRIRSAHVLPNLKISWEPDLKQSVVAMPKADYDLLTALSRNYRINKSRALRDVGEGLIDAHAAGVANRDVKPENVVFINGKAKIIDWGLALDVAAAEGHFQYSAPGTPGYSAPELYHKVTYRAPLADVYSFTMMWLVADQWSVMQDRATHDDFWKETLSQRIKKGVQIGLTAEKTDEILYDKFDRGNRYLAREKRKVMKYGLCRQKERWRMPQLLAEYRRVTGT